MVSFDKIASGLSVAEGPVAMADGSIILVEVNGGRLTRVEPDGKITTVANLGGGPNGVAVGPDGAMYICNNGGYIYVEMPDGRIEVNGVPDTYDGGSIQRVDLDSGILSTLYTECNGMKLKGPNDIVFDIYGGFWFTDTGKVLTDSVSFGALYYASPDGSNIIRAKSGLITPNGVGLSPDGAKLYVAESLTNRLVRFNVEGPGIPRVL